MPLLTVIATKPATVKAMLPAFRHRYPDAVLEFPVIHLSGFYRPPLPRGRGWADHPIIEPLNDLTTYRPTTLGGVLAAPHLFRAVPGQPLARIEGAPAYERAIAAAERLYAAVDPDALDCWGAAFLRQRFAPAEQPFRVLRLWNMAPGTIERALADADHGVDLSAWFAQTADAGRVKAYFDHQFAVNSLAILGRTFGTAGQATPWVSKYQVQALYDLARFPNPTPAGAFRRWRDWRGSGKYAPAEGVSLGGVTTWQPIFQQLQAHGWLALTEDGEEGRRIHVTPAGQAAIAALHPDCEDRDLPFRLDRWMMAGFTASRPAIDRYLRTFFGKQKRFLEHRGPTKGSGAAGSRAEPSGSRDAGPGFVR
jgi:hypothetical protein